MTSPPPTLGRELRQARRGLVERCGGARARRFDPAELLAQVAIWGGALGRLMCPVRAALSDFGQWAQHARAPQDPPPQATGGHWGRDRCPKRIERAAAGGTGNPSAAGGCPIPATRHGDVRPYHRRAAQPLAGAHGRLCGAPSVPLVKTPGCQPWIGCDPAVLSIRGGGRCQVEHDRLSLCSSPYRDRHAGPWPTWQKGRDFWRPQEDKAYAENPITVPRY